MIADVNAVANDVVQDSVAEVSPEKSPDENQIIQQKIEAEASIGQLEKEIQMVVEEKQ